MRNTCMSMNYTTGYLSGRLINLHIRISVMFTSLSHDKQYIPGAYHIYKPLPLPLSLPLPSSLLPSVNDIVQASDASDVYTVSFSCDTYNMSCSPQHHAILVKIVICLSPCSHMIVDMLAWRQHYRGSTVLWNNDQILD